MKSNRKTKTIRLLILVAFLPIFINNSIIISNLTSNYNGGSDQDNLKILKISGKIHIDDTNPSMNWSVARDAEICTGNGTYSEPYVIEDLVIDGGGSGDCILIENSDVYFRIENCTVYNSEIYPDIENWWYNLWNHFAGIRLSNVNNSLLIDNDCYSNNDGIHVDGFNNTISGNTANNNINGSGIYVGGYNNIVAGNTANNNDFPGILLSGYNSTVSGNIAENNTFWIDGIMLYGSNYNNVSGNTAPILLFYSDYNNVSGNTGAGIALFGSDYNTISGNTASYRIILDESDYNIVAGNDACWEERGDCEGNVFSNNNGPCPPADQKIPGYNLFFLLGILSVATILMAKKFKKS